MAPGLSRRRLLRATSAAAALWLVRPWPLRPAAANASGHGQLVADPLVVRPTLEAFADTLIPGERRTTDDRAVAGAAAGPGAVQAGAVDLLLSPHAGTAEVATAMAAGLNLRATAYALEHGRVLDPAVAPVVALDFEERTELLVRLVDGDDPDQQLWEALAALVFLAYHTAGHLPTAEAVRDGHPGLTAIGFPLPDADGLWRFPQHSYERVLATAHPATTPGGHPR